MKLELTDEEWMQLIDGERKDGLAKCCANISALRDVLISAARDGGYLHPFLLQNLRRTLGWCYDSHDLSAIPVIARVHDQLDMQGYPPHEPFDGPESVLH